LIDEVIPIGLEKYDVEGQVTHLGRFDLDDIGPERKGLPPAIITLLPAGAHGDINDIVTLRKIVKVSAVYVPGKNATCMIV
jgi:hypothetical protein